MIGYLIQLLVFQALFLLAYELFLKRETFFDLNRAYLLITPFVAAVLPLLEFELLQNIVPAEGIVQLPALIISENNMMANATQGEIESSFSMLGFIETNGLPLAYFFGAMLSSIFFLRKYLHLQHLKKNGTTEKSGKTNIIRVPKSRVACSVFNTVFLGESLSEGETRQILKHELEHVRQKHSWDLMLFELMRILLWFDPLVYRYQSQLSMLHEYIADEKATQNSEKNMYFRGLLNAAFDTRQISFTNRFFNKSLIKKRIAMMQKPKSKPNAKLKYLLVLPLVLAMLTYVACSREQDANQTESLNGVKTIEVESIKSIDDKREAEIVQEIQNIGKKHEKVVVVLGENGMSLVFTKADWAKGFIDRNKEDLHLFSDKMIISDFKNSTTKGPFTVVSPNGAYFDFTTEKLVLVPPPPPGPPPSPFGNGEIPFAAVDKTPVFPGCEGLSNEGAKTCFSSKIAKFIDDNFNKGLAKELGLKGSLRIQALFKIDQNGEVVGVKARAQHPELEKETIRVVSKLPDMIPGKQNGKSVEVWYSLPIILQLD